MKWAFWIFAFEICNVFWYYTTIKDMSLLHFSWASTFLLTFLQYILRILTWMQEEEMSGGQAKEPQRWGFDLISDTNVWNQNNDYKWHMSIWLVIDTPWLLLSTSDCNVNQNHNCVKLIHVLHLREKRDQCRTKSVLFINTNTTEKININIHLDKFFTSKLLVPVWYLVHLWNFLSPRYFLQRSKSKPFTWLYSLKGAGVIVLTSVSNWEG